MDASERGLRVKRLLEDEAVVWTLDELKKANYELFVKAQTNDDRLMAQARAHVTQVFLTTLQALVDVGERENIERERRERGAANSHE